MELLTSALVIVLLQQPPLSLLVGRGVMTLTSPTETCYQSGWRRTGGGRLSPGSPRTLPTPWNLTTLRKVNLREIQSSESQSSESQSSESQSSEESSEEVFAVTTLNTPTAAMTTISRGDTTEPDVMSTEGPTMENLTPTPAATPATPAVVTTPGAVTDCVTHDIPTPTPITDNRGDN
ncbi:secretory calcium-binding phosphoprotein 8 [Centroberyx affinis]|uniref:secretory calcium-binding phosphoprotein 8 n=1 Tax=Centroberyx affinis TaxID=166261 RepID=UPI003A5BC292